MYADSNSVEHQITSNGAEYAMVDRKVKEKKHSNPTQPDALYQVICFGDFELFNIVLFLC